MVAVVMPLKSVFSMPLVNIPCRGSEVYGCVKKVDFVGMESSC